MLGAFANAFRTPDLRRKLLFVLFVVAIFRLGSQVPAPGVNVPNVQDCFEATKDSGVYGLINLFSGGALLQLELTTRMALTARVGLAHTHDETLSELTGGISIY